MANGKHSSDEGFDWETIPLKKILIIFLVLLFIAGVTYGVYYGINVYKERNKIQEVISTENNTYGMPEEVAGYPVLGQLVIDKLEIKQYILDSVEEEALKNGVSKLYGEQLNEVGNFCIAGHNYEGIFKKLNELEVGDKLYILDRKDIKTEYEIVGIYENQPEDLACLLPNEKSVEITLITCENGSTARLIVKAEKIEEVVINEDGTIENTVDV